ncbi:hypothetical protein [Hydrogenophaga sp. 5NK40-0174]|uniref:hypothetical protein n=1 Tax=Hydrogenophaga sp. 5NK40-0174 TaxID=3127649 RepID=UPI0031022E9E
MTSQSVKRSKRLPRMVGFGALVLASAPTGWAQEGIAPSPLTTPPVQTTNACLPGSEIYEVADELLRAYERGDLATLQRRIDPRTPGLGRILDGTARAQMQQIRVSVRRTDQSLQCGPDVASIHFLWEKRSQSAVDLKPSLEKGLTALLLVNAGPAGEKEWRVVSVSGLNLFAPVLRPPPLPEPPPVAVQPPPPPAPVRPPRASPPPPPPSAPPSTTTPAPGSGP